MTKQQFYILNSFMCYADGINIINNVFNVEKTKQISPYPEMLIILVFQCKLSNILT